MADPFVAEIRVAAFNFAPSGWATCDGQILPISQNTALFSLLGTLYGGNGQTTFGLPNLRDSAVLGHGQGPGLSEYFQGSVGGTETVTLLESEMPAHVHAAQAAPDPGELQAPAPNRALARSSPGFLYKTDSTNNLVSMAPQALAPAGGSFPHNNRSPYLTMIFIIALQGIFPARQ